MKLTFMLLIGMMLAVSVGFGDDWPGWLGPNRDGVSAEKDWKAEALKDGAKVLWQVDVGIGHCSAAIADGRLYTLGNDRGTDTVWCLDARTGKTLWKHSYPCKPGPHPGPAATPTVDGDRVYTFSRQGNLFCFNAKSGDILWSTDVRKVMNARSGRWGYSCSPLVFGDKLMVQTGAAKGSLTAFDKQTGKVIWNADGGRQAYSSPIPFKTGDKTLILLFAGRSLRAIDPADGKVVWKHPWTDARLANTAATPVISGSKVFISTAYSGGSQLLEVDTGAPKVVWETKEMLNHFNNSILWEGHLYGVHGDRGRKPFLRCLDFGTGKVKWSQEGLGKGSVMIADGKLIVMSANGELVIAPASPDGFKPVSRAKVLTGLCWTHPILSNGRIYCRSHPGKLVCVDVRK